jgi:phosphate transport system ATP-binding protein
MESSHIVVEKLNASYGGHQALKDISVRIPKKQLTVIMGPSGCGKTTLLKTLNRLVDLADGVEISGKVLVDGVNVLDNDTDLITLRKKIGLIAQAPSPLPMSIYDNVAYGPRVHGTDDRKELDKIVENCLELVGLWDEVEQRLHEPASRLSVGQQQRLCLARTIAVKPEIILCDEPTSALDPVSARKVETQLLILKKYYTVVFVTHILSQARRLADYVIFLYLGELVEHGPANAFFAQPSDPRTKAYLQGTFG